VTTGEVEAELKGHTLPVRSVGFSHDGSQVISGSDDNTVLIWNATTSESQLMTTPEITLPDTSVVRSAEPGKFHIVYPPTLSIHHALSISDDHQWIKGALYDCWIPPNDRDFISSSFWGNRACFGYKSGRVVILDMTIISKKLNRPSGKKRSAQ
jgi:hypothetical protein